MTYKSFWDKVHDGGAAIFERFDLNPYTKKKQKNPLRDNSNNFSITFKGGKYLFRDWVSDVKGDALLFLMEALQIEYGEAVVEAERIYNLLPLEYSFTRPTSKPDIELPQAFPSEYELRLLRNHNSNFHTYCLNLGVSTEHLQKWNVGASAGFTYFAYQDINQVYVHRKRMAYTITGNSIKQETKYLTRKDYRFKECFFGEHLLRPNHPIFIVESEKTAIVASFFYPQYDFLAVGGANGLSNKIHRIEVLTNKEVYWLGDADQAGRNNSSLQILSYHASIISFKFQKIDLFPQYGLTHDCKYKGYDLADWLRDHLPEVKKGNLLSLNDPNLFYTQGYLSELLNNPQFCQIIFQPQVRVNLQAGTGSGKTTLAKIIGEHWHKQDNKKVIICVPLNAIAESKHEESKLTKVGGIPYFVSKFLQDKYLLETYHDIETNPVLFCNYDALPKLCEIIRQGGYDFNLIVDEQHCLTMDYGFRREKVQQIYTMIHQVDKCLLLSADTIPEAFTGFRHLIIENLAPPKKVSNYQVKDMHKILPALVQQIRLANRKTLVLLNSKKQLSVLKKVLIANDLKVHIIESGGNLFNDEAYQTLMKQKKFPANVDVLLCTSVIATGIDIYVQEPIHLIYCENRYGFNTILCNQFFARIRNGEQATYATLSLATNFEAKRIEPSILYQNKLKQLEKTLAKLSQDSDSLLDCYFLQTPFAEKLKVFYRDESGKVAIDKLAVSYWVSMEKICMGSPSELSANFTILQDFASSIQAEIKLSKEEQKLEKIVLENQIFALFQQQRTELAQALLSYTQNQPLKQFIRTQYPSIERIYAQHTLPTLELAKVAEQVMQRVMILAQLGIGEEDYEKLIFEPQEKRLQTNAKFSLVLNRLKINLCLEANTSDLGVLEQAQIRQYQAVRIALKEAFVKNEGELTSEQIQTTVNRFYTLKLSRHKCTQITRSLFSLQEKIRSEDGKKTRYYVCQKETSFTEVCQINHLKAEPIVAKMQDYLRKQRLEQHKLLQLRKDKALKKEVSLNCSKSEFRQWFYGNFTKNLPKFTLDSLTSSQYQDYFALYEIEIERSKPMVVPF